MPVPDTVFGDFYNFRVEASHVGYVKLTRRLPEQIALQHLSKADMDGSRPYSPPSTAMLSQDEWPLERGVVAFNASTAEMGPAELRLEVDHRADGTVLLGMALQTVGDLLTLPATPGFRVHSAALRLGGVRHGEIVLRGGSRPCAAACCNLCFHQRRVFFDLKVRRLRQFDDEPCSVATSFTADLVYGFGYRGTHGPFIEITDLRDGVEYSAWLAHPDVTVRTLLFWSSFDFC